MVSIEYANAYSEVLEILKYIEKEDYNKIPNSWIELFETNSNKEYIVKYNPNKTLDEQNVSKRAKAIIGILFRDYWATDNQREKIITRQKYDRLQIEKTKSEEYSTDNLFKKQNNNQIKEKAMAESSLTEIKKDNILKVFLNLIKEKINIIFNKK